ncbi:glycosyltransferase [Desulfothermus okinawensis]
MGKKQVDVAIFIPSFGNGGADRMSLHLCRGLSQLNYNVDLIVQNDVRQIKKNHLNNTRIIYVSTLKKRRIKELVNYINTNLPKVILSTKGGDSEAISARKLAKGKTKVVLRHGTTFSKRDSFRPFFKRFISEIKLRRIFSRADLIIANSQGVANDIIKIANISEEKVKVIPNPTIDPEIFRLAQEKVNHEWFLNKMEPIILGAGGFRKSKDFPTLIKAFYLLQRDIPAKLVILGEGRQRKKMEKLISDLNIGNRVWLPGHQENPYKFMAKADLFVLSSLWEGCPNVLIEAMALGIPVVSTDCPSGPREILNSGEYGMLVPPGDPEELKKAIKLTLENPISGDILSKAVGRYNIENSCKEYAKALGLCE